MGTTTFYLKHNDIGSSLNQMSKEDIEVLSKLHPFGDNNHKGWRVPVELHNGNIYILVFWRGRLMRLDDAPAILNHKYYDKYSGKKINEYEWTLLRKLILNEVDNLDREFKKSVKKAKSLLIVNKRFHTLFTIRRRKNGPG